MKTNIFAIGLAILILSGCSLTPNAYNEVLNETLLNKFRDTQVYRGDFSQIPYVQFIPTWMKYRVEYRATYERLQPEEILRLGYCDCDGYALLYMNIAYVQFGLKYSICFLENDARKIIDGGTIDHAIVRAPNGETLHAQTGEHYTGPIGYEFTFDEIFIKE